MWLGNVGYRLQGNQLLEHSWCRCTKVRTYWPRIITLRRARLYKEYSESTYCTALHQSICSLLTRSYVITQKKFNTKGNLDKHILTHKGVRRFPCDLCEYKATTKHCLAQHILTRTGEKPFACDQCGYSATQKSILVTHKRSHTGEKPYSCTLCDYKANTLH